jgi:hypothetical protein
LTEALNEKAFNGENLTDNRAWIIETAMEGKP